MLPAAGLLETIVSTRKTPVFPVVPARQAPSHSPCLRQLRALLVVGSIIWLGLGPAQWSHARPSAAPTSLTNHLVADTPFATEYYVRDSGVAGPAVLIVGGVHGNEPAGAAAAESIRHWPLTRGKLVVVPRANVLALAANKRLTPGLSTNLSNLNRNYPRAGRTEPPRGELAQAIWNLALQHQPDFVLDLHEGFDFHQLNNKSVGSSIIASPASNSFAAADLMLAAVNRTIERPVLKFVRRDLPVDSSLARAAGEHLGVPGMTLETTWKYPLATRVRQHETMVHALLHQLNMITADLPPPSVIPEAGSSSPALVATPGKPDAQLRIALYAGPGTGGAGPPNLMERLNQPPTTSITRITPDEIRTGALTNYQVVIFAGGSASKQAEALAEDGREAVRQFVGAGGGYIGICAGAYLATSGFTWGLNLVNAKTVSPQWRRGRGDVRMELTQAGRAILGERTGLFDVLYVNGPIVATANLDSLPAFEPLAYFRTELAENDTPVGVMVDSPAILAGGFRQGRVVCISPHPEQTDGLEDLVPRAAVWVAAPEARATRTTSDQ
jgi:putative intracellular protease/amidase